MRRVGAAAIVLIATTAPGATAGRPTLTVFGAADLAFAFKELAPAFERSFGVTMTLVLGSTGNLARQIEHGAPADVFFAANRSFVDALAATGAVIPETRALYARGRLALVTSKRLGRTLSDLRHLASADVRRIAIANPAHAPYGLAAEQALRALGLWETLRPRMVYGENIRHTLQFVESGAADAGIVARSVATVPGIEWAPVDPALHAPIDQVVAVVRRSAHPELALAFIQFVAGPEGRSVMRRYGF